MQKIDEFLKYSTYLNSYKALISDDHVQNAHWSNLAQENHLLAVTDRLLLCQSEIILLGARVPSNECHSYLIFGILRRILIIWRALRNLFSVIPPDRNNPLQQSELTESIQALNDIYLHIMGINDNYALLLKTLFGEENFKGFTPSNINLFKKQFRKALNIDEFTEIFSAYKNWDNTLKDKRDAIVHAIPLSIAPSNLNEEQLAQYNETNQKLQHAHKNLNELMGNRAQSEIVDAASRDIEIIEDELSKIGEFRPLFFYDPSKDPIPIYPTVPEDVGILISLINTINHQIGERL